MNYIKKRKVSPNSFELVMIPENSDEGVLLKTSEEGFILNQAKKAIEYLYGSKYKLILANPLHEPCTFLVIFKRSDKRFYRFTQRLNN